MSMIFKKAIPRRTFLRGVGTAIALPLLDGMIPVFGAQSRGGPAGGSPGIYLWSQRENHETVDASHRGRRFRDDPDSGAVDSFSGSTSGIERTGRQGC